MTNAVWIDGKPIYKKTIPWTSTALAVNANEQIQIGGNIKAIVESHTMNMDSSSSISGANIFMSGGNLTIANRSSLEWPAGSQWYITILYIKN
jgi:hypothetical protein